MEVKEEMLKRGVPEDFTGIKNAYGFMIEADRPV